MVTNSFGKRNFMQPMKAQRALMSAQMTAHFYLMCFGKCCPPFTYNMWAKGGGTLHFKIESSI
jgi:hypothetical protein